jgi:hypothetical protein
MYVVQRISDGKYWKYYYLTGKQWVDNIYQARLFKTRGAAMQSAIREVQSENRQNLWHYPNLRKKLFNEQFIRPEVRLDYNLREDLVVWHPIPNPQCP